MKNWAIFFFFKFSVLAAHSGNITGLMAVLAPDCTRMFLYCKWQGRVGQIKILKTDGEKLKKKEFNLIKQI